MAGLVVIWSPMVQPAAAPLSSLSEAVVLYLGPLLLNGSEMSKTTK